MPEQADGAMPELLSQTGAFQDVARLVPKPWLVPYDLAISFWSDGASKRRWMGVPMAGSGGAQKIKFSPTGEWKFPKGTVFVKHFELATDEHRPEIKRRLETRLLVCDSTGGVYGVTYQWRADNRDAKLLHKGLSEQIAIQTATGTRTQTWVYPSREDCLTCHTVRAGGVLGPKTRQLNCPFPYASEMDGRRAEAAALHDGPDGTGARLWSSSATDNQLRTWNHLRLFEPELVEAKLSSYPALAAADDQRRNLGDRARSYLDANCAYCHRPGGTVASFDARYDTPLAEQGLVDGPVLIDEGLDGARVVAPRDIWRSVLFLRVNTLEGMKMPPLAHQELDRASVALLREWIESLPGRSVLPPPSISPPGGHFAEPVAVALAASEAGAEIHYTLDGTVPNKQDPIYQAPLRLTGPAIVRAKAYKTGFTRSITAQQVFVVGE
jgi:mono/diheme cytochrome c family protein